MRSFLYLLLLEKRDRPVLTSLCFEKPSLGIIAVTKPPSLGQVPWHCQQAGMPTLCQKPFPDYTQLRPAFVAAGVVALEQEGSFSSSPAACPHPLLISFCLTDKLVTELRPFMPRAHKNIHLLLTHSSPISIPSQPISIPSHSTFFHDREHLFLVFALSPPNRDLPLGNL